MSDDEDKSGDETETHVEEVNAVKISRTEMPEFEIDFDKFRDLFVLDSMGNKIRFGDVYRKQKTVIFFVRHFLDFITKDYLEDLAVIPLEYLQEADVRLVVIGPAPYKYIKDFKNETGFQGTLYCDPDREIYKALGLKENMESAPLGNSKHIKQNFMMGMARSTWKAMKVQDWQGDIKQQGGAFVMGPGEVVHYYHVDRHSVDHASINEVLTAAGVQPVSFPLDARVQQV